MQVLVMAVFGFFFHQGAPINTSYSLEMHGFGNLCNLYKGRSKTNSLILMEELTLWNASPLIDGVASLLVLRMGGVEMLSQVAGFAFEPMDG